MAACTGTFVRTVRSNPLRASVSYRRAAGWVGHTQASPVRILAQAASTDKGPFQVGGWQGASEAPLCTALHCWRDRYSLQPNAGNLWRVEHRTGGFKPCVDASDGG
jgi:hypothetical protein